LNFVLVEVHVLYLDLQNWETVKPKIPNVFHKNNRYAVLVRLIFSKFVVYLVYTEGCK